jgi:hypothetical protein
MRVLLISKDERHAFLLEQLEGEGNEVLLLCKHDTGAWRGLVQRAASLEQAKAWAPDVVLIDSPGFGHLAKVMTDAGFKVFGGSKLQDKLAEDCLYGMSLLENAGVATADFTKFQDVSDASDYVQGKSHPWLMRFPSGETFNADNDVDLQLQLARLEQEDKVPASFTLQRGFPQFIDHALVIRPEFYMVGLVNSEGLMNPVLKLDLARNLLPDGQGIPTVEGVTMRSVPFSDPLPQETLKKLDGVLQAFNYTGFVYLGCVTEPAPGGGERCCVVDFQLSPPDGFWAAFARGLNMTLTNFLDRAVNPRRSTTPYEFATGYVCSRKLTLPPYPNTEADWLTPAERFKLRLDTPHTVFTNERWGVYWNDVYRREDGDLQACGPLVGYATGCGSTYAAAERDTRNIARSLPIRFIQMKVDDSLAPFNLG